MTEEPARSKSLMSKQTECFAKTDVQGNVCDPTANLVQKVHISGTARSSRAASMLGETFLAGKDDRENVRKIWFIPITNNVKTLFVMMILFAVITIAQYFAAIAANSNSLKADCISMGVDAFSYLGNILGESSEIPAKQIVLQLFFSMLSIFLLVLFNTIFIIEVLQGLFPEKFPPPPGDEEAETGVVAWLVILFAGFGLLFDFIGLGAFYYYAKKDATAELIEMKKKAEEEGQDVAKVSKPKVNMLTALCHTLADLIRSTTTFIEGLIFLANPSISDEKQEYIDNICALIICITIYLGAAYALYEWVVEFWSWFSKLGEADSEMFCSTTCADRKPGTALDDVKEEP